MATAKQVGNQLNRLGKLIPEAINFAIQTLAARIDSQIILANPVDTGRSRANWLIGVGDNPEGELNIQEDEGIPNSGVQFDAGIALKEQANLKTRKPEQTIFIVNNTSYIEQLNDGSSQQAPANFVQSAIMQGIQSFKGQKIVAQACKRL
jgi:hypothetical protein